jgi:hypothetical protein
MKQIKNTISVDSNRSPNGRRVCLEATSWMDELANRRRRHCLIVTINRPTSSAANSLGNINAGFRGIAGLARVSDILSSYVGSAARVASQPLRIRAIGAIATMSSVRFGGGGIAFFA